MRPLPRRADRRAPCPPRRGGCARPLRAPSVARAPCDSSGTDDDVEDLGARDAVSATRAAVYGVPPAGITADSYRASDDGLDVPRDVRTRATDAGNLQLAHAMHGAAYRSSRTRPWESP